MTTTTLHGQVQRNRFAHHALAALAATLPAALRAFTHSHKPTAAVTSIARDAEQVRRMARSFARTDPGFAADLYAAASRHEANGAG